MDSNIVFVEACGTGEVLTVIYDGGTHPGLKRRIVVTNIEDDRLTVREVGNTTPKTYIVGKTRFVDDDYPSQWVPENVKWMEIEPTIYFSEWAFNILPVHYSTLGVERRTYIDKEATKAARAKARNAGISNERVSNIKIKRTAWAESIPRQIGLCDGELFYGTCPTDIIQVICRTTIDDQVVFEVHLFQHGLETVWKLTDVALINWLKSGVRTSDAMRVQRIAAASIGNEAVYDGTFPPL